jgi:2-dehydro-3-deoxyglucarate aldolase
MKKNSIGSWITLGHPSIAEIMGDSGFDWLCIDMEHSVIDYFEAQQLILAIQSKGILAFVRVGENNDRIIKRVLDAGADGIIVPMVKNKEEALKAINSVYYPPFGKRGVGLARAQEYGFGFDKYKKNKAKEIKLIIQIEHIDAINNLEEILNLEGIDGTFIGPYDLSASLGKPGKFKDKAVVEALDKYIKIAINYDKLIGIHVTNPDYKEVLSKKKQGYNFIAFSTDIIFLGDTLRKNVSSLKLQSNS